MTSLPDSDIKDLRDRMMEVQDGLTYTMWGRLRWFLETVRAFDAFEKNPSVTADHVSDYLRTSVNKVKAVRAHVISSPGAKKYKDKAYTWFASTGEPAEIAKAINLALKASPKIVPYIACYMGPSKCYGKDPELLHQAAMAFNSKDPVAKKGSNLGKKKMKPFELSLYLKSTEHVSFWCTQGYGGYKSFFAYMEASDGYEDIGFEGVIALFGAVYYLMCMEISDQDFLKGYQNDVWPVAIKAEFEGTNERWLRGPILSKYASDGGMSKKKKKAGDSSASKKKSKAKVKVSD